MGTSRTKSVTVSLPVQLVAELDRLSERDHRARSDLLREALGRYIRLADRSHTVPIEDVLPEEIEAMRSADEEFARGECARLEDLQRELGLRTR
jgi:metal-responsive CopG/Arc/MetJ family transcriptional regulator